jgi:hypothetical protein
VGFDEQLFSAEVERIKIAVRASARAAKRTGGGWEIRSLQEMSTITVEDYGYSLVVHKLEGFRLKATWSFKNIVFKEYMPLRSDLVSTAWVPK